MDVDGTIYLDYQASTPVDPRVVEVMSRSLERDFANPSSDDHALGWRARSAIEAARASTAAAFGAASDEILFTSGATEANNIAIMGAARAAPTGRRRVLISAIEHKSALEAGRELEREGFDVEHLPVDRDGLINTSALQERLNEDVALVSVGAVNNETGVIQPIETVVALAAAVGTFVHTDATQAPLALPVDLTSWGVDAASLSSHKIYGPKGIGALFLSGACPWTPSPLVYGGGQEKGLRSGTLPTFLCCGFARAAEIVSTEGAAERVRIEALRNRLVQGLSDATGARLTASNAPLHPGAAHMTFDNIDAADLLSRLQPHIAASLGSACTSGLIGASHVLLAMGLTRAQAMSGIRFSLGRFSTMEQIDNAVHSVTKATTECRQAQMSVSA